jgi:hypothetical protein
VGGRSADGAAILALAGATALVFGRVVGDDFIPEDLFRIEEAAGFVGWLHGNGSVPASFFRPVGWLYAGLLHAACGAAPAPYYAAGLALHALAGALLYLLIRAMTGASAPAALLAAAFFVVSPAHTGLLYWIPTYFNVLAHVAGVVVVLLVWRALGTGRAGLVAATAVYALGILAYAATAAIVPAVALLAFDAASARGDGRVRAARGALRDAAPFLAVVVAFAVVERMRGSFGGRWTAGPLQILKNVLVFASIPYYPFPRFGITATMESAPGGADAGAAMEALAVRPLAVVMVVAACVTLAGVMFALMRGARARRLVVCEVRQVAVEDATLLPWIVTTRAHWLPRGLELDVAPTPCAPTGAAEIVTFRFVGPGRLERLAPG